MKPILDVACGGRMFYFDKQDTRVHFNDIRRVNTTLCDGRAFEVNRLILSLDKLGSGCFARCGRY